MSGFRTPSVAICRCEQRDAFGDGMADKSMGFLQRTGVEPIGRSLPRFKRAAPRLQSQEVAVEICVVFFQRSRGAGICPILGGCPPTAPFAKSERPDPRRQDEKILAGLDRRSVFPRRRSASASRAFWRKSRRSRSRQVSGVPREGRSPPPMICSPRPRRLAMRPLWSRRSAVQARMRCGR